MRAILHMLTPILLLALGIWGYMGTQKLKEEGYKLFEKDKKKSSAIGPQMKQRKIHTKVQPLIKTDYLIHIQSQGIVRAHNATTMTAQVSGRITEIAPQFEDGAYFKKNDVLLTLDTADFLTAVETAKARLAKAEAVYIQEEARAKQALLNWKDAGFHEKASDLVLRKPQLRDAEANVLATQSSVDQAIRNLQRTKVRAPYDGRVRKRKVGLGQQIGATTSLGDIFATDYAEVRLPLTARDLNYYTPPSNPNRKPNPEFDPITPTQSNKVIFTSILNKKPSGSPHSLTLEQTANSPISAEPQWLGNILRAEGELDAASRQLFIIARIDDPFGIKSSSPTLFIGQPLRASIPAHTLKNIFLIPRKNLSALNEILLVREGKIKRLRIHPIWSNAEVIAIRDNVLPDDQLCTSQLPYAPEGASVEIIPQPKNSSEPTKSKPRSNRSKKSHHH